MPHKGDRFNRRQFLQTTALGAAAMATGTIAAPAVLRGQGAGVKIGVLQPVTGALSYSRAAGQAWRHARD